MRVRHREKKSKSEFRYNYNTGHMTDVFEEYRNRYHSVVGITHDGMTFGRGNMPVDVNPQRHHSEKAFVCNGVVTNYKFSESDFPKVKSKVRKERVKKMSDKSIYNFLKVRDDYGLRNLISYGFEEIQCGCFNYRSKRSCIDACLSINNAGTVIIYSGTFVPDDLLVKLFTLIECGIVELKKI